MKSARLLQWLVFYLFFRQTQTSSCMYHFLQKLLKLLGPSLAKANLVQRVFIFYVTYKSRWDQRVTPFNFFRHCANFFWKFFNASKESPLWVFRYFATKCMLMNPKGSPFYIFRHYVTFSERKKLKISNFFYTKSLLRFLSLRYSADLRRSRLVYIASYGKTLLNSEGIEPGSCSFCRSLSLFSAYGRRCANW